MDCFIRSERLSSWAGLCPGHHVRSGKKKVVIPFDLTAMLNVYYVKLLIVPVKRIANLKGYTVDL